MQSKSKTMWLRRGELSAVLTALCALLAVSPQAFAASGPVASQHQVMLWWLQSSMSATPAQAVATNLASGGLQSIAPHEAAALLASLQGASPANPSPVIELRLAGARSRPAPRPLNWNSSARLRVLHPCITACVSSPSQPMLEPHMVAFLNGVRTNSNLE